MWGGVARACGSQARELQSQALPPPAAEPAESWQKMEVRGKMDRQADEETWHTQASHALLYIQNPIHQQ